MVYEQSNTSKCFIRWRLPVPTEGSWERSRLEIEKQEWKRAGVQTGFKEETGTYFLRTKYMRLYN